MYTHCPILTCSSLYLSYPYTRHIMSFAPRIIDDRVLSSSLYTREVNGEPAGKSGEVNFWETVAMNYVAIEVEFER